MRRFGVRLPLRHHITPNLTIVVCDTCAPIPAHAELRRYPQPLVQKRVTTARGVFAGFFPCCLIPPQNASKRDEMRQFAKVSISW